jgi:hypothetical protein
MNISDQAFSNEDFVLLRTARLIQSFTGTGQDPRFFLMQSFLLGGAAVGDPAVASP